MRDLLAIYIVVFSIVSCNPVNRHDQLKQNVVLSHDVIRYYMTKADLISDSIKKYELDSISDLCIKYIYILYGPEKVIDQLANENVEVFQCNIMPIDLIIDSNNVLIRYKIFLNDSIPVNSGFNTSFGNILNGFIIDRQSHKPIRGILGGTSSVEVYLENIEQLSDSIQRTDSFKKFHTVNYKNSHPNYKKALSRVLN